MENLKYMQLTESVAHTPGEANSSSASQIPHVRYYFNTVHTTITIMKKISYNPFYHKIMLLY